jgi:hypothetical protein
MVKSDFEIKSLVSEGVEKTVTQVEYLYKNNTKGILHLSPPSENNFTEYGELSKDKVLDWIVNHPDILDIQELIEPSPNSKKEIPFYEEPEKRMPYNEME